MATSKEMTSGRPFPLIFNFALPLLLGNLLQQTYSLVDAAIVGQFLGINDLAAVGAGTSVVFLILGFCNGCCGGEYIGHIPDTRFLQRMLRRIRHSGGTEVRCEGLRHDAAAGVGQSATSRSNVGCDSDCYQSLLCRYSEGDAYP